MKKPRCCVCEVNRADYLCDFAVGVIVGTSVRIRCSKPLCEKCRTCKGKLFLSGRRGGVDTYDHCPSHKHVSHGSLKRMTLDDARQRPWPDEGAIALAIEDYPMLTARLTLPTP